MILVVVCDDFGCACSHRTNTTCTFFLSVRMEMTALAMASTKDLRTCFTFPLVGVVQANSMILGMQYMLNICGVYTMQLSLDVGTRKIALDGSLCSVMMS